MYIHDILTCKILDFCLSSFPLLFSGLWLYMYSKVPDDSSQERGAHLASVSLWSVWQTVQALLSVSSTHGHTQCGKSEVWMWILPKKIPSSIHAKGTCTEWYRIVTNKHSFYLLSQYLRNGYLWTCDLDPEGWPVTYIISIWKLLESFNFLTLIITFHLYISENFNISLSFGTISMIRGRAFIFQTYMYRTFLVIRLFRLYQILTLWP